VTSVVRICQQLDGIPLAIEIAAAQARALPIDTIAERLDQRFAWLNKRAGETASRQRTLHTLIDWSYGLLNPEARSLLLRLSVFAGGWTLEAAEAVNSPDEPCADLLAELVDHSLVVFGADVEHRRYGMHEIIRQFAQEYLRGSDQEPNVLERHARYYAGLISRAAENRTGQPFAERLQIAVNDHDNLRRTFEWLLIYDSEQALALVAQLGTQLNFWELGGFFQEGRRWLQRALEDTQGSVSVQRGHALLAAANLSSAITDFDYGLQCVQQAQQLFQQLGDQRGIIDAQLTYCGLAGLAGKDTNIQAKAEEALRMAETISHTLGIAKARGVLGSIAFDSDKPETAIQYYLPNVALWRELGSPSGLAGALTNLGVALLELGEYVAARQAFEECRDIDQSLGYQRGVATDIHNLGETAYKMGEYLNARELLCESLRIRHHLGLPRGYPYSFELLAQVNEREWRYEQAVQLLAAAETLRIRIGAPLEQVAQKHVTAVLASARTRLGDLAFELAWSRGVSMTTEQAIALALS
ncbi:MAG TPA: tetratricopeptide repeat protein, partial [Anaerolineales bacterium]